MSFRRQLAPPGRQARASHCGILSCSGSAKSSLRPHRPTAPAHLSFPRCNALSPSRDCPVCNHRCKTQVRSPMQIAVSMLSLRRSKHMTSVCGGRRGTVKIICGVTRSHTCAFRVDLAKPPPIRTYVRNSTPFIVQTRFNGLRPNRRQPALGVSAARVWRTWQPTMR
jgi:hypothetical protein